MNAANAYMATTPRTLIAGTFRLAVTIQYFMSPDITYHISGVSLWALAEVTLLILVYSMPAFPRIFKERGTGIFSMRAWAGAFSKRSQTRTPTSQWSTSKERLTKDGSSCRKVGEGSIPMDDLANLQAPPNPTRIVAAGPSDHHPDTPALTLSSSNGIYYTREFGRTEERI